MSLSPVVEVSDGAQGPPGIGIIMIGDATVAEINAKDPASLEIGHAWVMLDGGTITLGDPDITVEANDMIIWAAEGNFVKLVIEVGPQGPQGPAGTPGDDGNTVLNGTTDPETALGDNGDFYIDTTDYMMWGPKQGDVWPPETEFSLVGPQGPPGVSATIVGYFGDVATPADLPIDGILPVDFDGPGRPAAPYTMGSSTGGLEGLFYQHPDGPNSPEYGEVWVWFPNDSVWSNIGKIVGPEGPQGPAGQPGPEGPQGPPGETFAVIAPFGQSKTPADLPVNGFIPVDWDAPGVPAQDIQFETGWGLIYTPADETDPASGEVWYYVNENGDPQGWYNAGKVQGPQGETGPQGPPGPTAVSADAGNIATLGTDSLIYVPDSGGGSGGFVYGMIMPFYGTTPPTGWAWCDGLNGTPDLGGRVIIGANTTFVHNTPGGTAPGTITSSAAGAHGHNLTITAGGAHTHPVTGSVASHSHTLEGVNVITTLSGGHDHGGTENHTLVSGEIPNHAHHMFGDLTVSSAPNIGIGETASAGFNDGGEGNRYYIKSVAGAPYLGFTGYIGGGTGHKHGIPPSGQHSHTVNMTGLNQSTDAAAPSITATAGSDGSHSHTGSAANAADHTHTVTLDYQPYFAINMMMYVGS